MTLPVWNSQTDAAPAGGLPRPGRRQLSWLAIPAASGVVLGLAWWLLAPGGLNLVSGNPELAATANPDSWLPRDLVLAALFLLAGCFIAVLLDGKSRKPEALQRMILAIAGGAVGGLIAWLSGLLAAQWWGPAVDPALGTDPGFSLRSLAVLCLWPGSTALITFLLTLWSLMTNRPDSGAPARP
ncbi:hypothetical protein [Arthrobacter cavernae]|uniref:DUF2567 domain-containing protein n=1 Tax=Arthrobacter cavernae TaxID=2817681 RepID=A0A939HI87_9MICC|nr:hypothetical protein [Arthrobacter cavernae]MBO1268492.1 hypothetical protein [Arthrobacter cavernae]